MVCAGSSQAAPTASVTAGPNGDKRFAPANVTVDLGGTVTWTNASDEQHTVTSDTAGLFDRDPLRPGATFDHTFDTAGTFAYHCDRHREMRGTVAVGVEPTPTFSRTLTLAYSNARGAFQGLLSPSEGSCTPDQTVTVFKVRAGPDLRIGSDATNAGGSYRVPKARTPGRYYATVGRRSVAAGVCLAARSPDLTIP